jgi:hypothetical protein
MSSSNANNTTEMNAKQQTDSEYLILKYPEQYEKVVEDAFATIHIYLKAKRQTDTEMPAIIISKMKNQDTLIAMLKEQLADARRPFDEKWKEREAEIHAQYDEDYADGGEGFERIKDELWDTLRDDIRDELKDEISNM